MKNSYYVAKLIVNHIKWTTALFEKITYFLDLINVCFSGEICSLCISSRFPFFYFYIFHFAISGLFIYSWVWLPINISFLEKSEKMLQKKILFFKTPGLFFWLKLKFDQVFKLYPYFFFKKDAFWGRYVYCDHRETHILSFLFVQVNVFFLNDSIDYNVLFILSSFSLHKTIFTHNRGSIYS